MKQQTIKLGTKTALITTDDCEGETTVTAIIFAGFGTEGEVALRSKDFKTEKGAIKWAEGLYK